MQHVDKRDIFRAEAAGKDEPRTVALHGCGQNVLRLLAFKRFAPTLNVPRRMSHGSVLLHAALNRCAA